MSGLYCVLTALEAGHSIVMKCPHSELSVGWHPEKRNTDMCKELNFPIHKLCNIVCVDCVPDNVNSLFDLSH